MPNDVASSVNVSPLSHASHWSLRLPSQCRPGAQSRATMWCVGVRCGVRWFASLLVVRTLSSRLCRARSSSSSDVGVDFLCLLWGVGVRGAMSGGEGGGGVHSCLFGVAAALMLDVVSAVTWVTAGVVVWSGVGGVLVPGSGPPISMTGAGSLT